MFPKSPNWWPPREPESSQNDAREAPRTHQMAQQAFTMCTRNATNERTNTDERRDNNPTTFQANKSIENDLVACSRRSVPPPPTRESVLDKVCHRSFLELARFLSFFSKFLSRSLYGGWPFVLVPRLYHGKSPRERWDSWI